MTDEHVKMIKDIQEFALKKACYIKSEIEKHEENMSQCMFSQAIDDMKDCMKVVRDCETTLVMIHEPNKLNPTLVK